MLFLLYLVSLTCVFGDSGSVQAPCNPSQTGFQVSSWPPTISGAYQYFYYEVRTTSSCSTSLSEILLNLPGCKDCLSYAAGCEGSIECYDSYWRTLSQCPYSYSWRTQDSFYLSKGYSVSGIKFSVSMSSGRTFRFSIKVPRSYASTTGSLWVRGKYFSQCSVPIPVCTCGTCPACPATSYRTNSSCICTPCSDCTSNTYQVSPCNATSNRICGSCTNCSVGAYETKSCDSTSDRMCSNCTTCLTGQQYETQTCTPTQNRVCNNCTNCLVGTYESKRCNSTSDRVCSNCTVCLSGQQYETRMCTLTQNRVCNNCTTCIPGETYQARQCTPYQNRVCNNCTRCAMGTYEVSACNVTQNRVCSNCTVCPVNTWMVSQCNATQDTVCRNCTVCGINEREVAPCTPTTPTICEPCPVCATCPKNAHLINNGLNCSCDDGFVQDQTAANFTCVPSACCGDCFACNFNGSSTCANHVATLCDFGCRQGGATCGSGSPIGWSASFVSATYNNSCCGSDGCSCFLYNISNGNGLGIEEFVLGLSCDLFVCAPGVTLPCISAVIPVDSENTIPNIDGTSPPPYIDPRTGIRGIQVYGLGIGPGNSWTTISFQFQGLLNVSSLPVPYSLFGRQDFNSPCFVSDTFGPDCVVCP